MKTQPSISYLVATKGILKNNRLLASALKANVSHYKVYNDLSQIQAVLAWGQKNSRKKAQKLSDELNLPLYTIEDGFLRSLDSGINSRYGASFILDKTGIYFDLNKPNDLQTLIFQTIQKWDQKKQQQSDNYIKKIIKENLSKYNHTTFCPNLNQWQNNKTNDKKPPSNNNHILVIDQVSQDASIFGAGACDDDFETMLLCAIKDNPNAIIWVKSHPAGKGILVKNHQLSQNIKDKLKQQGFDKNTIRIIKEIINPIALLKQVNKVYTVSSHMGFEALLLNKVVYCFGVNWYSGFGLTNDENITKKILYKNIKNHYDQLGKHKPDIYQLFYAAYIEYSYYSNPANNKSCDINEVMDYLILNRKYKMQLSNHILAYQISGWKKNFVKNFLYYPDINLKIKTRKLKLFWSDDLYKNRTLKMDKKELSFRAFDDNWDYVVWGQKNKLLLQQKLKKINQKFHHKIFCMEDGFIRSNGLGATLLEPVSIVLDDMGIYYDANHPSRLEHILLNIHLSDDEKKRADDLKKILLKKEVSKYNVGNCDIDFIQKIKQLKQQKNCSIHLVIGQVEDDASVQNCLSDICTNGELLTKVRQNYPNDLVIYKPHPDIEAGLRKGKIAPDILQQADFVAKNITMPKLLALLDNRDKVHTISSLTGFEALVRDLCVVCYGLPFYAGFGLTEDFIEEQNIKKQAVLNRRKRTPLTIQELIFGTLICYPIYHLPDGYGLATPEQAIDFLYCHQPKNSKIKQANQAIKTQIMRFRQYLNRRF